MTSESNSIERQRTLISLAGLSTGDAFGEMFFSMSPTTIGARKLPPGQWRWTDDTHMALSIVDVLFESGGIDPDALARCFAERYTDQPWRGYGGGARYLLSLLAQGADWRVEAPALFGTGSYGNGGAMRAAPVGAYFAGDPERAAEEAQLAASVTHAHPEGQAGAIAVAVAAAILRADGPTGTEFLRQVRTFTPASVISERIEEATRIDSVAREQAARELGTGQQIAAFDTVPYCLWIVAHHAQSFETALWSTVAGLGDRDTTCAIVGGVVAMVEPPPAEWLERREPLPDGYMPTPY